MFSELLRGFICMIDNVWLSTIGRKEELDSSRNASM